ncbi:MAG: SIMPL domain-containing protein [Candidatus Acidiferrum sp.]
MSKSELMTLIAVLLFPCAILAQTGNELSPRKTIEISATEKVEVPAETATVKIGYQNQAATKDAAYTENTRTANRILQALLDAGVPKDAIETESLSLARDEDRFGSKPQTSTFTGTQQWQIQSNAIEAQKIVDIAVAAGANQIESVDWSVADPRKLDDQAYAAALARAKTVAEQTAAQTGVKLGAIVSVSNSTNPAGRFRMRDRELMTVDVTAPKLAMPMLKLQPGTVEREASVTVTYAIAPYVIGPQHR